MIVLHAKDGGSIPPLGTNYLLELILISTELKFQTARVGSSPAVPARNEALI